ncbi:MAG: hypothetical protein OCD01_15090 [Fibrobacterales bacterium]
MPISVYTISILTFIITLSQCVVEEQNLPTISAVPPSSSQIILSSSSNASDTSEMDWADFFGSSFAQNDTTTNSTSSSSEPLILSSSSISIPASSSSSFDTIPHFLIDVADSLSSLETSFDYIGGKLLSNNLLPSQETNFQGILSTFLNNMYGLKDQILVTQSTASSLQDSTKIDSLVVVMDSLSTALTPLLPDSLDTESTP